MRGAIYARFSEGEGREISTTIEVQIEMCGQFAQADGVAIDPRHNLHRPGNCWRFGQEATRLHADGRQY